MKNILLFMTDFYGYNKEIISELEHQGWNVYWYLDKYEPTSAESLKNKLSPGFVEKKFDEYFIKSVNEVKDIHFDRILIIFGAFFMRKKHIDILRQTFDSRIGYYAWDSVSNFPAIEELFANADYAFTFDSNDSKKYNVDLLPLFYINSSDTVNDNNKYDVSTVMSFLTEKSDCLYDAVSIIPEKFSKNLYLRLFSKLYYDKLVLKDKKSVERFRDYFQYKSLSHDEVCEIFNNSKAIIDCPLPGQTGLTMRTFEVLALNKKLITTNKNIVDYDFYSDDNIFIVNSGRNDMDEFLTSDFNLEYKLSDKYSISSFIKTLLAYE